MQAANPNLNHLTDTLTNTATSTRQGAAQRPIVWSISSNDSSGAAGLSADARVAAAFGVHLCPIVACVTSQNSLAIEHITPISASMLDAQLEALATDMPPDAIKTGMLGSAALVAVVARWVDRLRRRNPHLPLVVDPMLRAGTGTGSAFADALLLAAYQDDLLPRATVITPNRREARSLLDHDDSGNLPIQPDAVAPRGTDHAAVAARHGPAPERAAVPAMARALRAAGAKAVCITAGHGDESGDGDSNNSPAGLKELVLDWLDTDLAQGWLALPRVPTPHCRGSGNTHATAMAAALARGFVTADAAVLAKMASTAALYNGYAAGGGAGPVGEADGFITDARLLPHMSWGDDVTALAIGRPAAVTAASAPLRPGIYALLDDVARLPDILATAAGDLCALQLRIKREAHAELDELAFQDHLQGQIATAAAQLGGSGITLYVNDHWQAAAMARDLQGDAPTGVELGMHVGQSDLEEMGPHGRAALRRAMSTGNAPGAAPLALGISSHSLWELARAASLAPSYIACGPVWPTSTKAMPWRAQGLDNLRWWSAMAPAPVVAIGGVLQPEQALSCAAAGASAVCLVRALDGDALAGWPAWREAWQRGRQTLAASPLTPDWPHPSLDPTAKTQGADV
jgi:hydroxymethylpyrimidine kinase/phosphomethylpyrimidine kinase/thiamine-phosphate diphosphorylase